MRENGGLALGWGPGCRAWWGPRSSTCLRRADLWGTAVIMERVVLRSETRALPCSREGGGGHGAPATVYYATAATDKGEGGVGNADTDNVESTG